MPVELSVVIPSHNRPDLLRACLASVVRHAPAGTEILVVDDGSADAVVQRAAQAFAEVGSVRLPRRRGFCVAANTGLELARGAIVELLNDDTEVTPGWAEAVLAHFADPIVAAVAPLVLMRDAWCVEREAWCVPEMGHAPRTTHHAARSTPLIDSAGDRYYQGGVAGKRGHGELLGPEYLQPCRVFGASASSAFYRREIVLRLGGFPESFGAYFEDVDLALRLQRAGYQTQFEPAARVLHRVGASYGKPRRALLAQQSRNEERVFWRNMPLSCLPLHLAVVAAKAWRRWQRGELAPFLCGRLRVLGEWPALVRHRRQLHALGPVALQNWRIERRMWEM